MIYSSDIVSIAALFFCALVLMLVGGGLFIRYGAQSMQAGERAWIPQKKGSVPTMGGIVMILASSISLLLMHGFSFLSSIFVLCLFGFGAIGFWDDWVKITGRGGISSMAKFGAQLGVAGLVSWLLVAYTGMHSLWIPGFGPIDLGLISIPWMMFILIGTSNAVNLTDGMDGLAAGCLLPNFLLYAALIALQKGLFDPGVILAIALMGVLVGFLYYNRYPARLFMGDVGALSLGAILALLALYAQAELVLIISGFVFVIETISVILQVCSYKLWKKRIFRMAPLHHHYELGGWHETQIVFLFSGVTLVLSLSIFLLQFFFRS